MQYYPFYIHAFSLKHLANVEQQNFQNHSKPVYSGYGLPQSYKDQDGKWLYPNEITKNSGEAFKKSDKSKLKFFHRVMSKSKKYSGS